MQGVSPGTLANLFTATESIGDDKRLIRLLANRRQQHPLSDGLRDFELISFKSECSGHSATTGVEEIHVRAHATEQRHFVGHFHQRLVMTMSLNDYFAFEWRGFIAAGVVLQEFAQKKGLGPQLFGSGVVWKQIHELITKN